jgi:hypothetical protein
VAPKGEGALPPKLIVVAEPPKAVPDPKAEELAPKPTGIRGDVCEALEMR